MGRLKRTSRNPITDIIRTIMYLKGKTPQEMAEIIGVGYGTYQNHLRCGAFTLYELIAICDACEMTIVIQGTGVNIDLKEYLDEAHKKGEAQDGE